MLLLSRRDPFKAPHNLPAFLPHGPLNRTESTDPVAAAGKTVEGCFGALAQLTADILHGLTGKPENNGLKGVVFEAASEFSGGRCLVQVGGGRTLRVKPANLRVRPADACEFRLWALVRAN